ncbi:MAG TPA: hypothetical protein P5071_00575, partial [Paludibacteraceae bacterium]|nr:hypothetical protein [Paludibacteraceae bacterium]
MSRKIFFQNDDDINEIIHRYEQFLSGKASGYFDIEEFENIAEYYLQKGRTKDSSRAIEFGIKLHPTSNELKTKRAKIYLASG